MRKNGASSEYMEAQNLLTLKSQKSFETYNGHKIILDSDASNHKGSRAKRDPESGNCVWSYHLMTLKANHGQLICIFSVIDEHTQEYLRGHVARHISAQNVIDELFSLFLQRGIPGYLFCFQ